MRKTFGRRRFASAAARPSLTWSDVSGSWLIASASTALTPLILMQSPGSLANLTSDPAEDLTILRVVGDFSVGITSTANWSLALIVADVTWTQAPVIADDNDKRILWQMNYTGPGTDNGWRPPNWLLTNTTVLVECAREAVHIDITPKVRVEPGKALYLVAYENTSGSTFTTSSTTMRVLYKRSGRRSR